MYFSPEFADVLVPKTLPPLFSDQTLQTPIDPALTEAFSFRSYIWANLIARTYLARIPHKRVYHFSTGFVHVPEYLHKELPFVVIESSFAFGGYLLLPGKEEDDKVEIETIRIGQHTFPIIKHFGSVNLHSSVPHVSSGASTCWVKNSAKPPLWYEGILTCRHLVSTLTIGSSITLSPTSKYLKPTSGFIADIDECTIDAAIIEINSSDFPKSTKNISVIQAYPGLGIEFDGASGRYSGTVLRIYQMNNYFGNLFGHRVIIDCHGKPGDSGAFVKTPHLPNNAVAIYMGRIPDGSGGYEGISQCLLQVQDFFSVEFYI